MNNLCADIGYQSLNKYGEQLCGDHIDVVEREDDHSQIIVLADGLGSGVKANILSTLTAKIISTMAAAGMSIDECVKTIAETLPVCAVRGVAYSTFTFIRLIDNDVAEIIEYDNPRVILLRNGRNFEFGRTSKVIEGKQIEFSRVKLQENDLFIAMSDGCIHAGVGMELNLGWERKNIIPYMEKFTGKGLTAKSFNAALLERCDELYGGKPGDDTTALTIQIRRREVVNLMIGPPTERGDNERVMSLFFAESGKHIVCGGTTSTIAANYLGKPLVPTLDFFDDIPPMAVIEGVDLVTEGVITVSRVLTYVKDYLEDSGSYTQWKDMPDGASKITQMLVETATDVNFFVGRAVNPAHQNPELPINFNIKMQLVEGLAAALKDMGKRIQVSYF